MINLYAPVSYFYRLFPLVDVACIDCHIAIATMPIPMEGGTLEPGVIKQLMMRLRRLSTSIGEEEQDHRHRKEFHVLVFSSTSADYCDDKTQP